MNPKEPKDSDVTRRRRERLLLESTEGPRRPSSAQRLNAPRTLVVPRLESCTSVAQCCTAATLVAPGHTGYLAALFVRRGVACATSLPGDRLILPGN